jgi:predicted  nucleic acid-binding Zn-ribbon protein
MVLAAEKALRDTKEGIKALRRDARQATTVDAQHEIQRRIQELEKRQRKQRQEIFNVEDEIMQKRDGLIESLERRLSQKTSSEPLFNVRWAVVSRVAKTSFGRHVRLTCRRRRPKLRTCRKKPFP